MYPTTFGRMTHPIRIQEKGYIIHAMCIYLGCPKCVLIAKHEEVDETYYALTTPSKKFLP